MNGSILKRKGMREREPPNPKACREFGRAAIHSGESRARLCRFRRTATREPDLKSTARVRQSPVHHARALETGA